jgi:hypothetical protein
MCGRAPAAKQERAGFARVRRTASRGLYSKGNQLVIGRKSLVAFFTFFLENRKNFPPRKKERKLPWK